MSNARRPTAARKVTKKTEESRREALDQGVRITLDGESYTLRIGDVTPAMARELRRETGHSFMALVNLLGDDPDIDVIAEAVWVARRMAGDEVALDDVMLDYNNLGDGFDIDVAKPLEVVDDGPEASGGVS